MQVNVEAFSEEGDDLTSPELVAGSSWAQHPEASGSTGTGWWFGSGGLWSLDLDTRIWTQHASTGTAPVATSGASGVVHLQQTAYVFGGTDASDGRSNSLHSLSLGSGGTPEWVVVSNATGDAAPVPRSRHTATALLDEGGATRAMLIYGGLDGAGLPLADAHEFVFASASWRALQPLGSAPAARHGHAAALLSARLLAVFGGADVSVPRSYGGLHLLDVERESWSEVAAAGEAPAPRHGHSLSLLGATAYVFGGVGALGDVLGDLWAFGAAEAAAGRVAWVALGAAVAGGAPLPAARWGHVAWRSGDGALLLAGGSGAGGGALTDGAWALRQGCAGDATLDGARGQLSDGAAGGAAASEARACRWLLRPATAGARVRLLLSSLSLAGDAALAWRDAPSLEAAAAAPPVAAALGVPVLSSGAGLVLELSVGPSAEAAAAGGGAGGGVLGGGRYFSAAFEAVCAPGHAHDAALGGCAPCAPGHATPLVGAPACAPCERGTYSDAAGATACAACPAYATTQAEGATLRAACACQPGYYPDPDAANCTRCADGAICPGGGAISARPGWCEAAGAPRVFRHCCEPEDCPGGLAATCTSAAATAAEGGCGLARVSFESLGALSASGALLGTALGVLALLLLGCLCAGVAHGWRRALGRLERLQRLGLYYSTHAPVLDEELPVGPWLLPPPPRPPSGGVLEIVAVSEAAPGAPPPPPAQGEVLELLARSGTGLGDGVRVVALAPPPPHAAERAASPPAARPPAAVAPAAPAPARDARDARDARAAAPPPAAGAGEVEELRALVAARDAAHARQMGEMQSEMRALLAAMSACAPGGAADASAAAALTPPTAPTPPAVPTPPAAGAAGAAAGGPRHGLAHEEQWSKLKRAANASTLLARQRRIARTALEPSNEPTLQRRDHSSLDSLSLSETTPAQQRPPADGVGAE